MQTMISTLDCGAQKVEISRTTVHGFRSPFSRGDFAALLGCKLITSDCNETLDHAFVDAKVCRYLLHISSELCPCNHLGLLLSI
jgi:hypothetical protein